MARADQIKALIQAHSQKEDSRFYSVALQVAAGEAKRGHTKLAADLKALIEQAKASSVTQDKQQPFPLARPKGELADLLTVHYPHTHLKQMALATSINDKLERILKEQRQHERLSGHGLKPRRKILLVGPPGTGKTLTASVIASELRLPLFVARFDSLITKFMGESASKLRLVFEALQSTRGVYLFDEFDSLGLQRGSQHDVAEMRRTLNMFLQLLEQDESDSLIVAATNHGASLDTALFRRFDDVIRYHQPDHQQIEVLIKNSLALLAPKNLNFEALANAANGLSHAEIVSACKDSMKDAVLDQLNSVSASSLEKHLQERSLELRMLKEEK